jgi:glycosyltransferase involved in cell wall biosynthesis
MLELSKALIHAGWMSVVPRVAVVTGGLGPGGSTTFLCNLGGEFVRRGIPVQVLSFEQQNSFEADFRSLQIPTICYDDRNQIMEDRTEAILRKLADFKPSVVLANLGGISFEVLRYVPASVFRIAAVQSDDPGVYDTLRFYAPFLDAIAAVSRKIEEKLAAMPEFARVPIKYLPYGVPMPQHRRESSLSGGVPLRIIYLGRLAQEQKRVRLFPQILEHLNSAGIPFHWSVVGEGPERSFLENSMRTYLPCQTISIHEKISYADVPELLCKHDVFLLASDYEGLPLSLLEAMGYGLVPVVSDLPSGIREVVNENTGFRVPTNDTDGYAEAIIWLHKNRESLKRLSENSHKSVVREFSTQAMADRWLAVFPERPISPVAWPSSWDIKPPVVGESSFRFSSLGKMLRRLKFALRR